MQTLTPTLKIATVADAEWLVDMARKVFFDTFETYYEPDVFHSYTDEAFTVAQFQKELVDPSATFVVAWEADTPTGYLKLKRNYLPEVLKGYQALEISRLYVDQQWHGRGIAQMLMNEALETAKRENYPHIWLGVWPPNARAIRFYEKYGFEIVGKHPFQMGDLLEEDLVMVRETKG